MQTHKDLIVWQKSIQLVKQTYLITAAFPRSELFVLTSQMRRASVSIPSNIAEGAARGHRAEYIQFLRIALGSTTELETQLILCKELSMLSEARIRPVEEITQEVLRMLNRLISSLNAKH